jgi:DNA-binding response OmpR family regulator
MPLPILLLEDDADVRGLLAEALSDTGAFAVHAVATIGEAQALVAARGNGFAAAVLDVTLPDGNGREFCADLRRQGFHWPVILLSGLASEDDAVRGLEAGADDYLAKPFSIAELLARVAAKLRHTAPRAGLMPTQPSAAA